MKFEQMNLVDYVAAFKRKEFTAVEATKYFISRIKKDHRNAVLEVFEKDALSRAVAVDEKVAAGKKTGKLAGAPIIIKDNILYEGHRASAGSKMLENFVAPYSATIVEKMISEDAVILGRANMDEFAMGTTGENSAFGATLNALDDTCVAGGSSSGSAVAVAAGLCLGAIGTDTGGSVRVPAVNNGVAGIKPTYGTVSRYGIVAYASGLEQAGAICKTAADVELLQNAISGQDGQDATLLPEVAFDAKFDISKLKVGFIGEVRKYKDKIQGFEKYEALLEWYRASGATVKDVSMPLLDLCLPVYYIIAAAEMTSNLARFDGVKYTTAAKDAETIGDLYVKTRTRYFGKEVKRRIMLGNFVLSSGYFDAYYGKAKKVQNAVRESFKKAFEGVDCIIMPVSNSDAVKLGEKINDPVEMYLIDIFTVTANVAGVPSLALPFDTGKKGLPIGYQLIGPHHSEPFLYSVAKFFEKGVRK